MMDILGFDGQPKTATDLARRSERANLAWIVALTGLTGVLALILMRSGSITSQTHGPSPALLGWLIYLLGAAVILYQPRYGVYLIVFLTLAGDSVLAPWYPFAKNFSSQESLLFVDSALIISPLETFLVLTLLSWLGRGAMRRKLQFTTGVLFWPAIVFIAFITFGLAYGLGTGGIVNAGLWEARAIFYLLVMLVLTGNLVRTRAHVSQLLWAAMLALFVEGVAGSLYYVFELEMDLSRAESITEHAAAIHMNTLFVLAIAAWLYKASPTKRYGLPLLLPCVALTYLATQRRAAFVGLAVALILIAFALYHENRRAFGLIAPPLALLGLAYLAAFWNASGALGQPARAIKSVLVTDAASNRDYLSNIYRVVENINIGFTIRNAPLTGVGFGQKFYIIVPMPDISFFKWWEYITHNSILWIWMKAGAGGFLSMLMLIGLAISAGVRALWRMPPGDLRAAALTATIYLVMHFLYAYVDMSWDGRSMVYVGAMMGLINSLELIASRPVALPRKRWRWQPDPPLTPGLRPLPSEELGL